MSSYDESPLACTGILVTGGLVAHHQPCPVHNDAVPWEAALAAAETRGRQQMIDALRDYERFTLWWDVQPWAKRDEDAWMTEAELAAAADYLEAIAKEGTR